ncbi:MAG: HAMP domain-containing sensor histidine kinase [Candidatus Hydrothermarchaeaceae archaeon]
MRIATKLNLVFLVGVFAVMFIGYSAYGGIKSMGEEFATVKEDFNSLKNDRIKELELLSEMSISVLHQQHCFDDYLSKRDPGTVEKLNSYHKTFRDDLYALERIPGGVGRDYSQDIAELSQEEASAHGLMVTVIESSLQLNESYAQLQKSIEGLHHAEHELGNVVDEMLAESQGQANSKRRDVVYKLRLDSYTSLEHAIAYAMTGYPSDKEGYEEGIENVKKDLETYMDEGGDPDLYVTASTAIKNVFTLVNVTFAQYEEVQRLKTVEDANINDVHERGANLYVVVAGLRDFVYYDVEQVTEDLEAATEKYELLLKDTVLSVIYYTATAVIFAVVGSFLLSRHITRPIVKLQRVAKEFGKGNLDASADITSGDEIEDLSVSFEEMAKKLKESYEGLGQKVEERTSEVQESRDTILNMLDDLKATQTSLKVAYDELKDIDRMKTNIISNVSHELRTPITIVTGVLDLAMDEEDSDARNELLKRGKIAIVRQNKVVENLIDASKTVKQTHEFKFTSFDISDVVLLSVKEAESSVKGKDITIKTSIPDDMPKVRADFSAVERVLDNLLDNAIKFNRGGVEVVVSAKNKGNFVEISVKDTGIGIPAECMSRIFDRLYQVDPTTTRTYSGTGMGLAVAKDIIKAHKGEIRVETEKGKGSTFYFTLPVG